MLKIIKLKKDLTFPIKILNKCKNYLLILQLFLTPTKVVKLLIPNKLMKSYHFMNYAKNIQKFQLIMKNNHNHALLNILLKK